MSRAAPATRTLYGRFTRPTARLTLTLFAALFLVGLPWGGGHAPTSSAPSGPADRDLYQAIIHRVRSGVPYATAAVEEQRAGGYPLRPFVVVRPPALAIMLSWAPNLIGPFVLEILLTVAVVCAWTVRLQRDMRLAQAIGWTALLVFTGTASGISAPAATVIHEVWAGMLIALSLALRTRRRFMAAVAIGLLAALIRELAMPYLAVMAAFAAVERRGREAVAFAMALALASYCLWLHAQAIDALVTDRDLASPGWVHFGGWPFVLQAASWNSISAELGTWASALLVPAALIGAYAWPDKRLVTILAGYLAGFMILGRPENRYWGLLAAPLAGVGLALAPTALTDLWVTAGLPVWRKPVA